DWPFGNVDMSLDIDLDADPRRLGHQQARRADAALAGVKIVADGDAAESEPFDKILVNKVLRRGLGATLVKAHHHGSRQPGCRQKAEFSSLVGEAKLRGIRAEI